MSNLEMSVIAASTFVLTPTGIRTLESGDGVMWSGSEWIEIKVSSPEVRETMMVIADNGTFLVGTPETKIGSVKIRDLQPGTVLRSPTLPIVEGETKFNLNQPTAAGRASWEVTDIDEAELPFQGDIENRVTGCLWSSQFEDLPDGGIRCSPPLDLGVGNMAVLIFQSLGIHVRLSTEALEIDIIGLVALLRWGEKFGIDFPFTYPPSIRISVNVKPIKVLAVNPMGKGEVVTVSGPLVGNGFLIDFPEPTPSDPNVFTSKDLGSSHQTE